MLRAVAYCCLLLVIPSQVGAGPTTKLHDNARDFIVNLNNDASRVAQPNYLSATGTHTTLPANGEAVVQRAVGAVGKKSPFAAAGRDAPRRWVIRKNSLSLIGVERNVNRKKHLPTAAEWRWLLPFLSAMPTSSYGFGCIDISSDEGPSIAALSKVDDEDGAVLLSKTACKRGGARALRLWFTTEALSSVWIVATSRKAADSNKLHRGLTISIESVLEQTNKVTNDLSNYIDALPKLSTSLKTKLKNALTSQAMLKCVPL